MQTDDWGRIRLARGAYASLHLDRDTIEWSEPVTGSVQVIAGGRQLPIWVAYVQIVAVIHPHWRIVEGTGYELEVPAKLSWSEVVAEASATLRLPFSLAVPRTSAYRGTIEIQAALQPSEGHAADLTRPVRVVPPAAWSAAAEVLGLALRGAVSGWAPDGGGVVARVTPGMERSQSVEVVELAWPDVTRWGEAELRLYPPAAPLPLLLRSLTRRFCFRERLTLGSAEPADLAALFNAALSGFRPRDSRLRDLPIAAEPATPESLPLPGQTPD